MKYTKHGVAQLKIEVVTLHRPTLSQGLVGAFLFQHSGFQNRHPQHQLPLHTFYHHHIMDVPESLEALQARHRKEQRDLVARITQKKKSASKKTRKGVNDECERLEQDLKERHAQELAALDGSAADGEQLVEEEEQSEGEEIAVNGVEKAIETLSISAPSKQSTPAAQPDGPKKKKNRAKERLARRAAEQEAMVAQAAEEAASLPDLREIERTQMHDLFTKYGLQEKAIRADGHCLYAAVADQLETKDLGLKPRIQFKVKAEEPAELPDYKRVRHVAADFIAQTPDDFVPFMEEPLEDYLRKIRETGEWGGHMELLALAKAYSVTINVLHADGRVDKIEPVEGTSEDDKEIWLGYYRHGFGLGEHYNSLRKTP